MLMREDEQARVKVEGEVLAPDDGRRTKTAKR
jgi:hypothetical protein